MRVAAPTPHEALLAQRQAVCVAARYLFSLDLLSFFCSISSAMLCESGCEAVFALAGYLFDLDVLEYTLARTLPVLSRCIV